MYGADTRKPPAAVTRALREVSGADNWRNTLFLAADWAVIAAAAAAHLILGGPILYTLAVIAIGTRMRALANLTHEGAHRKLFANRTANAVAARVCCAWPIFVDFARYEAAHRRHHQSLWRGEEDPDLALYRLTDTVRRSSDRMGFGRFLVRHVLLVVLLVMPARRAFEALTARRFACAGVLAGAVAGCWWTAPPVATGFVLYWLVPWVTTYQMCAYWAELGEHGGLSEAGHHWGSRNWRGSALTRWAIGSHSDDLYHLLHHWFPTVPHHRLRAFDEVCRATWPRYAQEDRCAGFFVGGRAGTSVLRDVWSGGAVPDGQSPTVLPTTTTSELRAGTTPTAAGRGENPGSPVSP